jgi:2-succinyl-5-enolpyruvyl-6-hydroxy-3-cyclohexene-1-carboxylate synthase
MDNRAASGDVGAANLRFARTLIGELHAAGVVAAVICPGSRSAPLALAIAEHPLLPHSVHIDERSAAFFALGYAKTAGRPVALLCTSGTAAAGFLPAIAEAHHARVPLVVLTADRPPELRAWGAPQTMDQRALYAGFTRWFEDTPCPSERDGETAYAAALARRAVCEATGPAPGPVHLNLPFREPLVPATVEHYEPPARKQTTPFRHDFRVVEQDSGTLGRDLHELARGVLLFGPDCWDPSLAEVAHALAKSLGWPLLADPASGLRAGTALDGNLMPGADLLLRDSPTAATLVPDLIVRFGGQPTSASLTAWMARHASADMWLVDQAAGFRDPQHRANRLFCTTARRFCELALAAPGAPSAAAQAWLTEWRQADSAAQSAAATALDAERAFLTPHLARSLWARLPEGATLYTANSMAIREIDTFAGPRAASLRMLANRGLNGIDGLLSSALGAAAAVRGPTVLWCGDLAFLHDLSGLVAGHRLRADLTIVVSNDDGGGIFEYLPIARVVARQRFERIFAVPHGVDLCAVARGFGWDALRVQSADAFAPALSRALAGRRHVIEVPIDRAANTALHEALYAAVRASLRRKASA